MPVARGGARARLLRTTDPSPPILAPAREGMVVAHTVAAPGRRASVRRAVRTAPSLIAFAQTLGSAVAMRAARASLVEARDDLTRRAGAPGGAVARAMLALAHVRAVAGALLRRRTRLAPRASPASLARTYAIRAAHSVAGAPERARAHLAALPLPGGPAVAREHAMVAQACPPIEARR